MHTLMFTDRSKKGNKRLTVRLSPRGASEIYPKTQNNDNNKHNMGGSTGRAMREIH